MIVKSKLGEDSELIGVFEESVEFSITTDSTAILVESLVNLYSKPVESIVREIASNCVDAHRERDLKKQGKRALDDGDDLSYFASKNAIQIQFNDTEIVFKDWGVGLSQTRVKDIFTVFGGSTKRENNVEIGGFGLGSKSPFAFTSTFFIRTARNGTIYKYMLSRGENIPTMDLLYQEGTPPGEDYNFTEVIIPCRKDQVYSFREAARKQLTYFPQIQFNVPVLNKVDKKFEDDDFFLDTISTNFEILIGGVQYPVDTSLDFKLPNIRCRLPFSGIKLKFDIGELTLVPSREAIRYTEETKKLIQDKLNKVSNTLSNLMMKYVARGKQSDEAYFTELLFMMYISTKTSNYSTRAARDEKAILFDLLLFPSIDTVLNLNNVNVRVTTELLRSLANKFSIDRRYLSHGNSSSSLADLKLSDILYYDRETSFSRRHAYGKRLEHLKDSPGAVFLVQPFISKVQHQFLLWFFINRLNLVPSMQGSKTKSTSTTIGSTTIKSTSSKPSNKTTTELKKEKVFYTTHVTPNSMAKYYTEFKDLLENCKKTTYSFIGTKDDILLAQKCFAIVNTFTVYFGYSYKFELFALSDSNYESVKSTLGDKAFSTWFLSNETKFTDALYFLEKVQKLHKVFTGELFGKNGLTHAEFVSYSKLFEASNMGQEFKDRYKDSLAIKDLVNTYLEFTSKDIHKHLFPFCAKQGDVYEISSLGYYFANPIYTLKNLIKEKFDSKILVDIEQKVMKELDDYKTLNYALKDLLTEDPVLDVLLTHYLCSSSKNSTDKHIKFNTQLTNFINERKPLYEKLLDIQGDTK